MGEIRIRDGEAMELGGRKKDRQITEERNAKRKRLQYMGWRRIQKAESGFSLKRRKQITSMTLYSKGSFTWRQG